MKPKVQVNEVAYMNTGSAYSNVGFHILNHNLTASFFS